MVAEVIMGLGAPKSAFDLARELKDIDNAARRNEAVIDLQARILAAQEEAAIIEAVRELQEESARLKMVRLTRLVMN